MNRPGGPDRDAAFSYRRDPAVPPFPDDRPILIFDGDCVFCSAFVQFILRHDRKRCFRFLAAQTPIGIAVYQHYGLDPVGYETNILLEGGRAWFKADSSIRVFEHLGFPWSMAAAGSLLPRAVRDWLYRLLARNRLRWFGTRDVCYAPEPADADRFIQ